MELCGRCCHSQLSGAEEVDQLRSNMTKEIALFLDFGSEMGILGAEGAFSKAFTPPARSWRGKQLCKGDRKVQGEDVHKADMKSQVDSVTLITVFLIAFSSTQLRRICVQKMVWNYFCICDKHVFMQSLQLPNTLT